MDAVGYVTKERGTDCFFLEPSIWERLAQFKEQGDKHGVQLVAEVHEHYTCVPLIVVVTLSCSIVFSVHVYGCTACVSKSASPVSFMRRMAGIQLLA